MNFIWRTIWMVIFSRFGSRVALFDESTVYFHVLPTDVDYLLHMNNGRYFSFMDLARFNFLYRNNKVPALMKNKIYGVVASESIRFKKSIPLFKRFNLTTRMMGWDEKYFYILHQFKMQDELCAFSLVKIRALNQHGTLAPSAVLQATGVTESSPPLPEWVLNWQNADHEFYEAIVGSHH